MHAVALFSGGLDSTVLLAHLLDAGHAVTALSVDYGQRHCTELDHARRVAAALGVTHEVAELFGMRPLLAGSVLTDDDAEVPRGHYEDESMKQTVVPNRNMLLISVAGSLAVSRKAVAVAYAAHGGDHAIYPDCRPEFADAMHNALGLCDWQGVELLRPFVAMSKADIVRRGAELGAPLAQTWSCYVGGDTHCGTCGTCVERREAFELAGVADPTVYDDAGVP